ncbi:germanicol synthase [Quercus suber]|uniref:Germanicol synthase n=1 Tax=Quercus suber TaxID=58331 RepID=A0AAW0M238_QUESU
MWKLKIAEGGNDPYIFSTNNFVGRQIWEFDPEAGSPEERAEVEEARQNFYKNRYQIKPSGDLLWRMQNINSRFYVVIYCMHPKYERWSKLASES